MPKSNDLTVPERFFLLFKLGWDMIRRKATRYLVRDI